MPEIQEIGTRQGWNVITGRSPKGKFYFKDLSEYIAVDNSGSEQAFNKFKTVDECLKWLNGERDA